MIATVSANSFATAYIGTASGTMTRSHSIDNTSFLTERNYNGVVFGTENFLTSDYDAKKRGVSSKLELGIYSLKSPNVVFKDATLKGTEILAKRDTIGWALATPIFRKDKDKWDNDVVLDYSASVSGSALIGYRSVAQAETGPYLDLGTYIGVRAATKAMPSAMLLNLELGVGYKSLGIKFSGTAGISGEGFYGEGMAALTFNF